MFKTRFFKLNLSYSSICSNVKFFFLKNINFIKNDIEFIFIIIISYIIITYVCNPNIFLILNSFLFSFNYTLIKFYWYLQVHYIFFLTNSFYYILFFIKVKFESLSFFLCNLIIDYFITKLYDLNVFKFFLFILNKEYFYCLKTTKYNLYWNYFFYIKGCLLNNNFLKINLFYEVNQSKINWNYQQLFNINLSKQPTLNLNIYTKYTTNFSFLSNASLILTILSVWQYWWWLSFIGIAILFNKVIFKLCFNTNIYVSPKTHSSLKSNGRWGDVIASAFPVFWCSNILLNSNLILRLTENHSESGWMTLRVRGKQWYWVYKLPVNLKQEFDKLPILIGRENKLVLNKTQKLNYVKYSSIFRKKQRPCFIKNYKVNKTVSLKHKLFFNKFIKNNPCLLKKKKLSMYFNKRNFISLKLTKKNKANSLFYKTTQNNLILTKTYNFNNNSPFLQIYKNNLNWYKKYYRHFYTIQQQPKSSWILKNKIKTNLVNKKNIKNKFFEINTLKKKNFLNKKRLISSYNTLLLPTNVNITVITNSFDVVHSWFIPGLGVKFDCVPGRSTHYTLRINKPGIYLGHCAEICGRFHHHMPIKIVALPLNQFLYYYDVYYPVN